MAFISKVLILKHTDNADCPPNKALSGILRLECENDVCDVHLSLINLQKQNGASLFLLLIDKTGKKFFFDVGLNACRFSKTLPVCPFIESGLCAGVFAVKNDIPTTLAFAVSDNTAPTLCEFKKAVAEKCLELKNLRHVGDAPNDFPTAQPTENERVLATQKTVYNDDAVATVDYYALEKDISLKLDKLKEIESENLQFENEQFASQRADKAQEKHFAPNGAKDEADLDYVKKTEKRLPYFATVQKELTSLFNKFPEEQPLKKLFPNSSFVRINYSEKKYYVVGLIKEDQSEKYICYGVPGEYSKNPPEQLKGFCSFVPASIFNMTGNGYWMMFQDAYSGDCVKMP